MKELQIHQTVTSAQLEPLLRPGAGPCVSIHLPMERAGPDTRKNPIVFRNALDRVRELLGDPGADGNGLAETLKAAEAMQRDHDFWQHQEDALALFLGPETLEAFVLSVPLRPWVGVSERFSVLPLLAALSDSAQGYVLALSEKAVRFYTVQHGSLHEAEVPDLPPDLETALQLDPSQSLQGHVVARASDSTEPISGYHGHGGGKDQKNAYRTEFLQRVNDAVARHLRLATAPLFLATVRANFALYQKINTYPNLADECVEGNFDRVSTAELKEQLREVLEQHRRRRLRKCLVDLREALGEGLATAELPELLRSAAGGSLRQLFLKHLAEPVTGHWNPDTFEVELDGSVDPRHRNLIDEAASEAWCRGGKVHFVDAEQWKLDSPWAGILRWRDGSL
jgi:hypothetical protein